MKNIGSSIQLDEPLLSGWAHICTALVNTRKELNRIQKDFVKRKYGMNESDILSESLIVEKDFDLWRIEDENVLMANAQNWRKGIPAYNNAFPDANPESVTDTDHLFIPQTSLTFLWNVSQTLLC